MKANISERIKKLLKNQNDSRSLMKAIFTEKRGGEGIIKVNGIDFRVVRVSENG